MLRTLPALLLVGLSATSASAQQLSLQIKDGYVTLDAANASVGQILAEWTRIGGTRIVNGDRISGGPVTLKLEHVPERQALDVILRSVAGYMAAPRAADATGASIYDRIMVLPTSTAPAATATARGGQPPRFQPPQPQRTDDEAPPPDDTNANPFAFPSPESFPANGAFGQPVFGQPQPGSENVFSPNQPPPGWGQPMNPFGQPVNTPGNAPSNPFAPTPVQPAQPAQSPFGVPFQPVGPSGQPVNQPPPDNPPTFTFSPFPTENAAPAPPQTQGNFGVVGTPVPGVVQQPTQPAPAGRTPRPPRL